MLRQTLQGIQGIEFFGILAMVLFVAFFAFILIQTLRMKKEEVSSYSRIPFEEDHPNVKPNHEQ